MKKLKKIFAFLLMVPVVLGFSACKSKKNNDNTPDVPSQEQNPSEPSNPSTPSEPSNPSEPSEPVEPVVEGFTVNFDYALPEGYEFLLANPASVTKEVGESVLCPTKSNISLVTLWKYFIGWYNGEELVDAVTGQLGDEITLTCKWNEEELRKYFYNEGVQFEVSTETGNTAKVVGYTGNKKHVIIPEIYKKSGVEYIVEAIDNAAFLDDELEGVVVNAKNYTIGSESFKNSKFDSFDFASVTSVGSNAFAGCVNFESIELPASITSIGTNVFNGCSNIKEITISRLYNVKNDLSESMVTYLGDINSTVEKVTLKGSIIEDVPRYYFSGWTALKTFVLNDTINSLGEYCFVGCLNLEDIVSFEKLNPNDFVKSAIIDTKFYNNATDIDTFVINNVLMMAPVNYSESVVNIPEGIVKIMPSAFKANAYIEEINLPSTLVVIGDGAFYNCVNLQKVNFAENNELETLNQQVFSGCTKLSQINLQNLKALTSLGNNVFESTNISSFVIPSTVESFGVGVFKNANIEEFSVVGELDKLIAENGVLYLIEDAKKTLVAYPKNAENSAFVLPVDVTNVSPYAFAYAVNLKCLKIEQTNIVWDYYIAGFENRMYETFAGLKSDFVIISTSMNVTYPSIDLPVYYLISNQVDDENYTAYIAGDEVRISINPSFDISNKIYNYYIIEDDRCIIFKIDDSKTVVTYREITELF